MTWNGLLTENTFLVWNDSIFKDDSTCSQTFKKPLKPFSNDWSVAKECTSMLTCRFYVLFFPPNLFVCSFFRLLKLWGLLSKKMFISEQTHESRRSVRPTISCLWQDTQPSRAPSLFIVRYPWQQWLDTWGLHAGVVRLKRIYPVAQSGLKPSRNFLVLTLPRYSPA